MKILMIGILLAQVGSCNIPEGDVEIKECLPEDQKEGYECKAFYIDGKLIRKAYNEISTPSSPSPSSPLPSASPIIPSPSPSPSPIISPSPIPSNDPGLPSYCKIEADGNFGEAPIDECPSCWTDYAALHNINIIDRWGIAFRGQRECKGPKPNGDCGCKVIKNVDITPHSRKPFLAHRRASGGSETHKGCQPANDSFDVPEIWVYPPNSPGGLCDPFSGDRYWCHHKAQVGQCGPTKFEVQAPGKASITLDVP